MLHVPLFDASPQPNQVRRPLQLWRKVSGSNRRPVASMLQPARARLHAHAEHSTLPTETPSRFVYAGQLNWPPQPHPKALGCSAQLSEHPALPPSGRSHFKPRRSTSAPPHTHTIVHASTPASPPPRPPFCRCSSTTDRALWLHTL